MGKCDGVSSVLLDPLSSSSSSRCWKNAELQHRETFRHFQPPASFGDTPNMSYQIPLDTIHQLQISLRNEANIPSYDPAEPFPVLPPLEHSISQVDPSPPYLRCKHCKGRLLRGIKSLFCVFCGKEQFGEIPPDPINFRSTTGYRWLLDSLQLDGSEVVELISEESDVHRGLSAPKNEMLLSDLLNLEIPWHPKVEKPENIATEAPSQAKSALNLSGVDLDNYFSERKEEVVQHASEEILLSENSNSANKSIAFQGQEDTSLFENAQPSTTLLKSKEHESDGSQSSWAAEFQSAGSRAAAENFRSLDPFPGSQTDTSVHVDTVFGLGNTNSGDTIPSYANADDWFPDYPRSTSGLTSSFTDPTNSSSVNADDLFQDNPGQSGSKTLNQCVIVDENDDSFDAWDDFMSSTGKKDHPNTSSQEEPTETNLFSAAGNVQEIDFGSFHQPDLFAGALNSQIDQKNEVQSEASTLNRTFNMDENDGNKAEVAQAEDAAEANTTCSKTDLETIMSQMHDLSFMLDSNLSIPQRSSVSKDQI